MKKKIMAVTLCLAMASTFVVGCGQKKETDSGKSEEKSSGKVEIEFVQVKREAAESYTKVIEAFQKKNPDIVIKQNVVPDAQEVLMTRASSDNLPDLMNHYTKVEDAVRFVEQTGCDSLAIAVGNAHGPYVKTPNLDLERIYAIRKKVNIPLVLHGCSDIPEEQIKEAVNLGMSKFNIATEYFRTMYQSIEKRINNQEFEGNGVKLMYDIREEMIDFVIQKIRLLNPNKYSM